MSVDFKDYQALLAKNMAPYEPPIIKTIEPNEAWRTMEGWLDEKIKATTKSREDILQDYLGAEIFSYEQMVRAKCLLDITSAELICYEGMLKVMQAYHARYM